MTERRNNPADPTAERTADQSTQTASGISADREGPHPERARDEPDEELIPRAGEDRHTTPRQFDRGTDDAALPADDASLGTKI